MHWAGVTQGWGVPVWAMKEGIWGAQMVAPVKGILVQGLEHVLKHGERHACGAQSQEGCLAQVASYLTGIEQPWSTKLQENWVFPLLTKVIHYTPRPFTRVLVLASTKIPSDSSQSPFLVFSSAVFSPDLSGAELCCGIRWL